MWCHRTIIIATDERVSRAKEKWISERSERFPEKTNCTKWKYRVRERLLFQSFFFLIDFHFRANSTKWGTEDEKIATLSFVLLDKNKNKVWERKEWKTFRDLVTATRWFWVYKETLSFSQTHDFMISDHFESVARKCHGTVM
jgi:hypothetical protein